MPFSPIVKVSQTRTLYIVGFFVVTAEVPLLISFDDLKRNFAVLAVENLGDCIAIPGEDLDLDWILMFLEEGYRFEGTFLDGFPFVLVQVKPMVIDSLNRTSEGRKKGALQ